MARAPQQRAPQASGGDDFYDEEDNYDGADGTDDFGGGRGEGGDESAGASEYSREGDPELEEENDALDAGYEDPPPPRRGEGRVQRLANENRELRRKLEERGQPAPQPQQPPGPRLETETEMEQRVALLDEATKGYERWKWSNQQQQAQITQTRVEGILARDEAKFDALCRRDKLAARLRDDIEAEFDRRVKNNVFVPREDIYYWLAGRERARGGSQETRRARETAQRRVDRQTVRPASGGSDVARPNRRERVDERTARARRLEGQQI